MIRSSVVNISYGRHFIPLILAAASLWSAPGALAATVWGATASITTSTCGGEVINTHSLNPLGSAGIDVERVSSQLSCGGMYGYAGDLPYAYARAKASLSEGTLGIGAQVSGLGQLLTSSGAIVTAPVASVSNVSANLHELLSFTVPAHTPGTITFTSTVTGSYTENVGSVQFGMGGELTCISDSCWGNLSGVLGGGGGIDNGGSGTGTKFYTIWLDIADVADPITFDLLFSASLSGSAKPFVGVFGYPNVVSGSIDYLHTAGLGITLPTGVTFSSASNQFLTGSVVPVPAAAWLFSSGFLSLIGIARRKKAA